MIPPLPPSPAIPAPPNNTKIALIPLHYDPKNETIVEAINNLTLGGLLVVDNLCVNNEIQTDLITEKTLNNGVVINNTLDIDTTRITAGDIWQLDFTSANNPVLYLGQFVKSGTNDIAVFMEGRRDIDLTLRADSNSAATAQDDPRFSMLKDADDSMLQMCLVGTDKDFNICKSDIGATSRDIKFQMGGSHTAGALGTLPVISGQIELMRLSGSLHSLIITDGVADLSTGFDGVNELILTADSASARCGSMSSYTDGSSHPVFQFSGSNAQNHWWAMGAYWDSGSSTWKSSASTANFLIRNSAGEFTFETDSGVSAGDPVVWSDFLKYTATNQLVISDGVVPGSFAGIGQLKLSGLNANDGSIFEAYTNADQYPLFQNMNFTHDNINLALDAYWSGTQWDSSDIGSNYLISKTSDELCFRYDSGIAQGAAVTWNTGAYMDTTGLWTFVTGVKLPTSGGTASTLDHYEEYTHTTNMTGAITVSNIVFRLVRVGKSVTFTAPLTTGTAAASTSIFGSTTLPTRFRPVLQTIRAITVYDSGVLETSSYGEFVMTAGGTITIYRRINASLSWNAVSNAGFGAFSMSWQVA